MPRKQRIEYPGAVYHIISRGNYRKELFLHEKTGEAFERTIFEAAERCGWKLYAYVIMSNHYHLVIETPEPNLVEGMKWLQSTFATRFNRLYNERGHVFQGALQINSNQ
jgi:REP element-mobilizing transposase RayT